MRITFLLGSGISLDAGYPNVGTITEQVLCGDGVWARRDGSYVIDAGNPNYSARRPIVEPILGLIGDVRRHAMVAEPSAEPTYEAIALALAQVHGSLQGEYESIAVLPFADQLAQSSGTDRAGICRMCGDALDYIGDAVADLLRRGASQHHCHLAAILACCRRWPQRQLTCATLRRTCSAWVSASFVRTSAAIWSASRLGRR